MAYKSQLKKFISFIVLCCYALLSNASTDVYPFKLYKHQGDESGPTILIIGGIQGDEPGGFTAATLVAMNYEIKKGNVWIVPNLNFKSILHSSRGLYGDMNRKFHNINKKDPDFLIVEKIKNLILDKKVDLVVNLHDGSGFYTPTYIDKQRNPYRWGQSVIIDQKIISASKFSDLYAISEKVANRANKNIPEKYRYFVKNTKTRDGNKEMEKTLTYFAIKNGKAAFGVEASKNFRTHERAYYHLLVVEAFMRELGVEYSRSFELNSSGIRHAMYKTIDVSLYNDKFYLPGNNLKKRLYYIPMRKDRSVEYHSRNPLVAVLEDKNAYKIKYGNRSLSYLHPQYFEFDNSLKQVSIEVDGKTRQVGIGSLVTVKKAFRVNDLPGYRVNVIGGRVPGKTSETDFTFSKNMIPTRFSIDRSGNVYRVEFYKNEKYSGMILVEFY